MLWSYTTVSCDPIKNPGVVLHLTWRLRQLQCYDDLRLTSRVHDSLMPTNDSLEIKSEENVYSCDGTNFILPELKFKENSMSKENQAADTLKQPSFTDSKVSLNPIYTVTKDGLYEFLITIDSVQNVEFQLHAKIEIKAVYGYLSAADRPLLVFYGCMCLLYVVYGIIWLIISFLQWRDLLRIQFWIGGVVLLGMMEKAVFYAEYQNVNSAGVSVSGAELFAELVSCGKRTLARMLVIIVSLGFGIVKPRLGAMLHRVVGIGAIYFLMSCIEAYLRVTSVKNEQNNQLLVAGIPLAILDSATCWWIFTALIQTTRTLRLRRNMVKLELYRHFTNTLIFAVLASLMFILYVIKVNHLSQCAATWRDSWVEIAFWHVLFSILLLVIMILWRPTNNNQRYAFTPLLDNPDDDDEENQCVTDAYGVKIRAAHQMLLTKTQSDRDTTNEEDLRWVEENIPSAMAESSLPIIDSDEEIINTKFEVSKMQ